MDEGLKKLYESKVEELKLRFQRTKDLEAKLREERDTLNLRLSGVRDELLQITGAWGQVNELLSGVNKQAELKEPDEEKKGKDN